MRPGSAARRPPAGPDAVASPHPTGTDATEPYEDVVHSGAADVLLKKYHIGEYQVRGQGTGRRGRRPRRLTVRPSQPSAEELAAAAAAGAMAVSRRTFGQKIVLSLLPLALLLIAVALA